MGVGDPSSSPHASEASTLPTESSPQLLEITCNPSRAPGQMFVFLDSVWCQGPYFEELPCLSEDPQLSNVHRGGIFGALSPKWSVVIKSLPAKRWTLGLIPYRETICS